MSRSGRRLLERRNLPNNVDHTENQTVLAPHGQVTTVSVSGDWVLLSCDAEHRVHLAERADQVRIGIRGEQDWTWYTVKCSHEVELATPTYKS